MSVRVSRIVGSHVIAGLLVLWLRTPFCSEVYAQASEPPAKQNSGEPAKEQADDPFSPLNRVKEERGDPSSPVIADKSFKQNNDERSRADSASAPEGKEGSATELNNDASERIDFQVVFKPQQVRRGQIFQLIINGAPKPGYHTYPMTKLAADPAQDTVFASKIVYKETPGIQPLWPVEEKGETEFEHAENVGWFLEYRGPFTWTQDILVLPDAKPGRIVRHRDSHLPVGQPFQHGVVRVADDLPAHVRKAGQLLREVADPRHQRGGG